jgi:hypothetical protein
MDQLEALLRNNKDGAVDSGPGRGGGGVMPFRSATGVLAGVGGNAMVGNRGVGGGDDAEDVRYRIDLQRQLSAMLTGGGGGGGGGPGYAVALLCLLFHV